MANVLQQRAFIFFCVPYTVVVAFFQFTRHCKCTADSTGDRRTRECSCLPAAHLPDTSPLRVDGDRCRIAGGPEFLGEMGAEVRPPVGRQSIYGGDTGGCCDFEGRDAPKDMAALRERLRQKDVLRCLVV